MTVDGAQEMAFNQTGRRPISRGAIVAASLFAASCGEGRQCETLSHAEALEMASHEKTGMLRRSTREYSANFESSEAAFARVGAETNGYAANVGSRGRNGRTLVALIEADCYIGWTERDPEFSSDNSSAAPRSDPDTARPHSPAPAAGRSARRGLA
jgi:hypothetical protein